MRFTIGFFFVTQKSQYMIYTFDSVIFRRIRTLICETKVVNYYFYNISKTIVISTTNCPCELIGRTE